MVDTVRSLSALQTLLADNTTGNISPQDVRDMLVSTYINGTQSKLENGKTSTDTPDDEFDAGTLDGKWTQVDIPTLGSASMNPSTPVDIYDMTTRSELLIQVSEGNNFKIRQDYTLPDGGSLIVAFTPTFNIEDSSPADYNFRLSLNDNDTDFDSGSYQFLAINELPDVRVVWFDGSTVVDNNDQTDLGHRMYFRVNRDTLTYSWWYSYDGVAWVPVTQKTESSAHNNIWIVVESQSTTNSKPIGITSVHWIRQGSVSIDPW